MSDILEGGQLRPIENAPGSFHGGIEGILRSAQEVWAKVGGRLVKIWPTEVGEREQRVLTLADIAEIGLTVRRLDRPRRIIVLADVENVGLTVRRLDRPRRIITLGDIESVGLTVKRLDRPRRILSLEDIEDVGLTLRRLDRPRRVVAVADIEDVGLTLRRLDRPRRLMSLADVEDVGLTVRRLDRPGRVILMADIEDVGLTVRRLDRARRLFPVPDTEQVGLNVKWGGLGVPVFSVIGRETSAVISISKGPGPTPDGYQVFYDENSDWSFSYFIGFQGPGPHVVDHGLFDVPNTFWFRCRAMQGDIRRGSPGPWTTPFQVKIGNEPPIWTTIPDQSANLGASDTTINLYDAVVDADHPDDQLTLVAHVRISDDDAWAASTDVVAVSVSAGTLTLDWGTVPGTATVRVRATDPAGNSQSTTFEATLNDPCAPLSVAINSAIEGEPLPDLPGTPGVSSGTVEQTSVEISVTAPATGGTPTGYRIELDTDSNFGSPEAMTRVTAGSVTFTGLTADTLYYYRARASNARGNGSWSTSDSVRTAAVPVVDCPGTPTLTVTGTGLSRSLSGTLSGAPTGTTVDTQYRSQSGATVSAFSTEMGTLSGGFGVQFEAAISGRSFGGSIGTLAPLANQRYATLEALYEAAAAHFRTIGDSNIGAAFRQAWDACATQLYGGTIFNTGATSVNADDLASCNEIQRAWTAVVGFGTWSTGSSLTGTAGQTYELRARARKTGCTTTYSAIQTVTLSAVLAIPGTAGLSVTRDGNMITATATAPTSGGAASRYRYQLSTSSSFATIRNQRVSPSLVWNLLSALPVGTYYVRVRAENSSGNGPWSTTSSVTIPQVREQVITVATAGDITYSAGQRGYRFSTLFAAGERPQINTNLVPTGTSRFLVRCGLLVRSTGASFCQIWLASTQSGSDDEADLIRAWETSSRCARLTCGIHTLDLAGPDSGDWRFSDETDNYTLTTDFNDSEWQEANTWLNAANAQPDSTPITLTLYW